MAQINRTHASGLFWHVQGHFGAKHAMHDLILVVFFLRIIFCSACIGIVFCSAHVSLERNGQKYVRYSQKKV